MEKPARLVEHTRGIKESREPWPALRERWPAAFPKDDRKLRPLANVVNPVAEAMGGTGSFTHGVLKGWKLSAAYCRAVLWHKERINLDGSPSGEMVDDEARKLAAARLVSIKAKREKRKSVEQVPPIEPPKPLPPPPPMPVPPPIGSWRHRSRYAPTCERRY